MSSFFVERWPTGFNFSSRERRTDGSVAILPKYTRVFVARDALEGISRGEPLLTITSSVRKGGRLRDATQQSNRSVLLMAGHLTRSLGQPLEHYSQHVSMLLPAHENRLISTPIRYIGAHLEESDSLSRPLRRRRQGLREPHPVH
jgi:hypothetical protein